MTAPPVTAAAVEAQAPGPRIPVVAAVIRDATGRVLLARRLPGGVHGGLWEFPGGKVEAGETARAALAREIREELDFAVDVGSELARVEQDYAHLRIRLAAFACRVASGVPRAVHCAEFVWVQPGRLRAYAMPEADVAIADLLLRGGALDGPGAP